MTRTIEIRKAGFTNKGAEMMLVAATQQVQARLPGTRVCVAPNYSLPFEPRARLGLWHRAELVKKGIDLGRVVEVVPARLRARYGFVTGAEVDVVLDAAGFAYSDQWKLGPSLDLARKAETWTAAGKKLILLPQAFGPFQTPGIADAMKRVADKATLIYAREQQSYDYLTGAVGERDNIRMCPDFTNLLKPVPHAGFSRGSGRVAIVPNARMLDMTDSSQSGGYEGFLAGTIDRLEAAGLTPFFLVHETMEDLPLAQRINAGRASPLQIIEAEEALKAKGLIAECDALIGSRFHALVSALAQAVPVIGTGWSHKYQELFRDYGYEEGLTGTNLSGDALDTTLAPLLTAEGRAGISARLAQSAGAIKAQVNTMWDQVFDAIG